MDLNSNGLTLPGSGYTCNSPLKVYCMYTLLSSWDIPLHIILMGYTTPYYPHAFYALLSSWQDNPPPYPNTAI